MAFKFSKMHGAGNDFVLLDLRGGRAAPDAATVRAIADRHTGVGFDQLLAVVDKTPPNSQFVDLLSQIYPASKFICCDRDVRDAAVSGWFHFGRVGL